MFLISARVPNFSRADLAHRHVRVAAERAFLHVAVADLEVAHQRVHLLEIGHGLFRRTHVGLGDDFDERRAGAVEIDAGLLRQALVQRLAGVLFEMRARDADALLRAVVEHDVQVSLGHHRQLVLADLVALGKVRVEVVLAREHRASARSSAPIARPNFTAMRTASMLSTGNTPGYARSTRLACEFGERAIRRRRAREDLGLRRQLRVDLESDDGFPASKRS